MLLHKFLNFEYQNKALVFRKIQFEVLFEFCAKKIVEKEEILAKFIELVLSKEEKKEMMPIIVKIMVL